MRILVREGTVIPGDKPGESRLHLRRLTCESDEEYSDIPLPSPGSTSSSVNDFDTIPDYLISRQTLEYVGFNDDVATMLWERWNLIAPDHQKGSAGMMTFESIFRAHVYAHIADIRLEEDAAWYAMLEGAGMNKSFQEMIMTPSCKEVRLSESCQFWVLDTTRAKFSTLKSIQATSYKRAEDANTQSTNT